MNKTRLEAFSDGVLAIIITIMVLELKVPHETSWTAMKDLLPTMISYVISFTIIGTYWGNHHHLLHTVTSVNSGMLWANLHLLFWLSLLPIATEWMGENNFAKVTVAVYAVLQDLCGVAYSILLIIVSKNTDVDEKFRGSLEKQKQKGIYSLLIYTMAIPAAFFMPLLSLGLFVLVSVMWFFPDRNIEKRAGG